MKVVTIIGARPQFIKAAVLSRRFRKTQQIKEVIVHTGQHFDENMSEVFFEEMGIPHPHYNLYVHSLPHGAMTGRMLEEIEKVLLCEKPDWVLVYGDTNSTLAGALAAKKLHIKLAHVEAGLRSFNMNMPEEINRIIADRISDLLFCPTANAMQNLKNEGFERFKCRIVQSGDVMQDAALYYANFARKPFFEVPPRFILCTIHRAENTDNPDRLRQIATALKEISSQIPIVLPVHPRTRQKIDNTTFLGSQVMLVNPVGYLEMIYLLQHCELVMTDSGGLQKEAFFFRKVCVTLREETEWVELVEQQVNILTGTKTQNIVAAVAEAMQRQVSFDLSLYGNGEAAAVIEKELLKG